MAAIELDPVFIRALRLLNSKSKESTAQLKQMLDEAIAAKKGLGPGPSAKSPSSSKQTSRSVSSERTTDKDKREAEKRKDLDRLKADLSEFIPKEAKRMRLDSPALSNSSNESPGSPWEGESGASSPGEFNDLQMNIELDCTCIVCKSFNQESNNKLMECSACQNLYHQECHEPPVSNSEASDPRLIWHCSRCNTRGQESGGGSQKNPASGSSSRSASVEKTAKSSEKSLKSSSSSKSSGGSSSSSSIKTSSKHHKPSPGKASSKHGKSSGHSSSSSSSNSTPGNQSSLQMSEAQKRLKLMKKQAAAASLGKKKK